MADDAHRPNVPGHARLAHAPARGACRAQSFACGFGGSRATRISEKIGSRQAARVRIARMFAVLFDQVASIVGRSLSATRQLASRTGRRACKALSKVPDANLASQSEVVDAFVTAVRGGRKPSFSRGWSGSPGRCL